MNKIKEFLITTSLFRNKELFYDELEKAHSYTYNGFRHFIKIEENTVRCYSTAEGTDGEILYNDTGELISPSIKVITNWINKTKEIKDE